MNRHLLICFAIVIVLAAGWAYHVNYRTIEALEEVDTLRAEIARERETMQVLRVEWAYLNAPDRLARLVAQNKLELKLVPLVPEGLGDLAAMPFPKGREEPDAPLALAPATPMPLMRPVGWNPQ